MERRIKIDIKGWLEDHYRIYLAPFPDVRINCPFCGDQKGRLYIAYDDKGEKTKKGHGYCQNEQTRHDFFELYSMIENLSDAEAANQLYDNDPDPLYVTMEELKQKMLAKPEVVAEKSEIISPVWPTDYVSLFGLTPEKWEKRCPKYMKERKIDQQLCNDYYLGYCTGGKFSRRMIVPVYYQGKLVAYQGRAMYPCKERKYMFNEGIKIGEYLFNYDNVAPEYDWAILVEGVFDAWAVRRSGFPNVCASFGKHLTEVGVQTIMKRFKRLLVFWDMDAIPEINELAQALDGYVEVFVTFLDGKDPDEATREEVAKAIIDAQPYGLDFAMMAYKARLKSPEKASSLYASLFSNT